MPISEFLASCYIFPVWVGGGILKPLDDGVHL